MRLPAAAMADKVERTAADLDELGSGCDQVTVGRDNRPPVIVIGLGPNRRDGLSRTRMSSVSAGQPTDRSATSQTASER